MIFKPSCNRQREEICAVESDKRTENKSDGREMMEGAALKLTVVVSMV